MLLLLIGIQVIGFLFFQALGNPMKTLVLSLSRQLLFLILLLAVFPVYGEPAAMLTIPTGLCRIGELSCVVQSGHAPGDQQE
jgi:Na+-driven multidrug efflux pump